ncbi:hypothetical protein CPB97_001523 [Podila verticillata]|nr:hypothetical protein CPB97_001523 [Podila verticillata]
MLVADTKAQDVVTMALPASEQDFVNSLMDIPYKKRASAAQGLALAQGDKLIPLLRDLLATKPAIHTIRVVQPAEKDVELAADGSNPNPVLVTETLRFPQTNASVRYYQREMAIAMATTLAAVGNKDAIALLISALNHPSTIGKKSLIQCLAKTASDDDLLTAARSSPLAVRDSLVATLVRNKRKTLANDILGKPRKAVSKEPKAAMTTRFRRALEKVKEYEREGVWKEYAKRIDVTNQPKADLCEEGETIKDVILTLQETLPPLHAWDEDKPENRLPKLCSMVENHLMSFLAFDAERVIQILKKTSWTSRSQRNYHSVYFPAALSEGHKAHRFWCHRQDDGKLLRDFWLHMMQIGDGVFVKFKNLPFASFLKLCRAPVVDELIRAALKILETDAFQTNITVNRWEAESHLDNIVAFAVEGVSNLVTRLAGCSAIKDRTGSAIYFQTALHDLVALLLTSTVPVMRQFHAGDLAFNGKLYNGIIKPLTLGVRTPYTWSAELTSPPLKNFPPLGQQMFEQIQTIFKPKSRMEVNIMSTIENLLSVLAPRDTSVYAWKDDEYEQPFSSIPAWDNSVVFTKCVSESLNRPGKPVQIDAQWVTHFNKLATYLKDSQKDEIAQWVLSSPNLKTLLHETEGNAVLPLLGTIFTNVDLRHQFVFPLVFVDKKEKEVDLADNIAKWAAYVDIRIPTVRALLVKETTKPAFEDRLKWIQAILKATQLSRSVHEWILTLRWLVPKIRNEIHPNLMQLAPFLYADYSWIPRQYLDDATLEQAVELEALYLKMDSQNASAISPVPGIANFLDTVANEALKRYIASPGHPFFRLGHEIPWRSQLTRKGEKGALESYSLMVSTPNYWDKDRHEETEIARRKESKMDLDDRDTQGMGRGTANIPEGKEEEIVKAKLNIFYTRWLSVKDTVDPDVEATDIEAFKKAQPSVWQSACFALHCELGWRWKESPTLVSYMEEVLDQLAAAPTKTFGPDKVLDWETDDKLGDSARHAQNVFLKYSDKWMAKHRHSLPSYSRFKDLRLISTEAKDEANERLDHCVLESGKRDGARFEEEVMKLLKTSPSAISLSKVRDYLSFERPDLLSDEHLSMTTDIIGMFNQAETAEPWNFFVIKSSRLSPRQCEILKARHLLGMKDPGVPFDTRVLHAEYFVAIPSTTVEDVAEALATPLLPSRITEALLMYLPTLAEPGVTLPLLLAPVYVQSHMARTAIHAVENALKHVSLSDVPEYILPLFPLDGRQQKVTVQKEGVRLACATMALFADPKIRDLLKDLWGRADLNVDVRSVILQSLMNLLFSPAAKEAGYKDEVDWIWHVLVETANSDVHKTSGAAFVLMATVPATKTKNDAPEVELPGALRMIADNATLSNLAVIKVPEVYVNRYMDEILIPLASELTDKDDEDLVEVRNQALQALVNSSEWVTPKNAVRLAKEWRVEASKLALEEDPAFLWQLYVSGLRNCVGKEVTGAVDEEAMVAWRELIGHIEDLVSHFLDKNLTRSLRQKALSRIQTLDLGNKFTLKNFEKVKPTVFHGKDSDLMQPLMRKALESVMWTMALDREINVFKPHKPMTQSEINNGSLEILLRIAHFSNRYVSDSASVLQWIQKLQTRASGNIGLKRYLGEALLNPHEELVDWIHLNDATLAVLTGNQHGMFNLDEISGFVERVASQDYATFYWTNQARIASLLSVEMNRHKTESGDQKMDNKRMGTIESALKPILARAQAEAWISGADAMIIKDLVTSSAVEAFCTVFPHLIGPILHSHIANSAQNVLKDLSVAGQLNNIVETPGLIMAKSCMRPVHNPRPNTRLGLSPLTVIIMDAFLNGKLEGLDLTSALNIHQIADEVLYGEVYPFHRGTGKVADFQGHDNPRTMQQVKKRWATLIDTHAQAYKSVVQSIKRPQSKTLTPMVVHAYRTHSIALLNLRPKYIAFRPLEYLEYVRINLTAPGTTLTIETVAQQIAVAFTPENISSDNSSFGWAPPLSLALDVIEHLMNEIRPEVEIEGHREVQIIELLAATTLQKWVGMTVETACGKLLAEHEGVEQLEARYLALVEELCQDGSGGQSVALQLGDFVPGGVQTAAEAFGEEDDEIYYA